MEYFNLIVLMLAFLTMESHAENQKFTIEPENQSAKIGTKVLLPCRVVGKQGVLQWTKDDFGLGTDRNLSGYEGYSMVGIEENGDYTLQIESLQLDDDAKYQCQVSPGPQGKYVLEINFLFRRIHTFLNLQVNQRFDPASLH